MIKYPHGVRNYKLNTPFRRSGTRQFIRGNYGKFAHSLVEKDALCNHMLNALSSKIKKEMRKVCKLDHYSILKDDIEGVKHFSWETVWLELQRDVPTLVFSDKTFVSTQQTSDKFYYFTDIKTTFTMYGISTAGYFRFIIW